MIQIRKGQAPAPLARAQFAERFRASFMDPAFRAEDASIQRLEVIAWDVICHAGGVDAVYSHA